MKKITMSFVFILSVLLVTASTGKANVHEQRDFDLKIMLVETENIELNNLEKLLDDDLYCTTGTTVVFNLLFTTEVRCVKCSTESMAAAQKLVQGCLMAAEIESLGF